MEREYFTVPVAGGVPDQIMTLNFNGQAFNVRVYFATGTKMWWLALSTADMTVTLSHIALRPDVMLCLEGKVPGYSGVLAVGMLRAREGGTYSSVDAFSGDFSLFFSDAVTV